MSEYPLEVNAAFVSRHGDGKDLTSAQRLNSRYDVAKALLSNQYSHLVGQLDKKAAAQHSIEMDEWSMILEDISLVGDVGRYVSLFLILDLVDLNLISRTRDTLFDAVYPLLEAIGNYAGCYVTLVAGNAEKDDTGEAFFTA